METCLLYGYNIGVCSLNFSFLCSHNFFPSSSGKSVTSVTSPRTLCGWCSTLLVGTPLSTREVWGFSLEGVPSPSFLLLILERLLASLSRTRHPYRRFSHKCSTNGRADVPFFRVCQSLLINADLCSLPNTKSSKTVISR